MSALSYRELKEHIGHKLVCVGYGDKEWPMNVAVECEDCNEVIVDFDLNYESDEDEFPFGEEKP